MTNQLEAIEVEGSLTTTTTAMSELEAAKIAKLRYGLEVTAKELRGERDQNFLLSGEGMASLLLKIANAADDLTTTELQVRVLRHIETAAPDLPVQRVLAMIDGGDIFSWRAQDGHERFGYLLTYLPGTPMAECRLNLLQIRQLGALAAHVDGALKEFKIPSSGRELLWDLKHAQRLHQYIDFTEDRAHRRLVEDALRQFDTLSLEVLRSQAIHNDLNPHNVIVDAKTGMLSGVIDFGDMVESPIVCEVAIACSYLFCLEETIAPLHSFVESYTHKLPLIDVEIAALPELIATRLAATVVISNWRARRYPANRDYILRNQRSAIQGLTVLSRLSLDRVREDFQLAAQRKIV